jgi:hypothetical protein
MRNRLTAIPLPDECYDMYHMSNGFRHEKTLVTFKGRLPNFNSLLRELYQMESQSDEEAEIMVDLPLTQLEGDD